MKVGDKFRVINPFEWTLTQIEDGTAVLQRLTNDGLGGETKVTLRVPIESVHTDFVKVEEKIDPTRKHYIITLHADFGADWMVLVDGNKKVHAGTLDECLEVMRALAGL
jgi:hypothetical protein